MEQVNTGIETLIETNITESRISLTKNTTNKAVKSLIKSTTKVIRTESIEIKVVTKSQQIHEITTTKEERKDISQVEGIDQGQGLPQMRDIIKYKAGLIEVVIKNQNLRLKWRNILENLPFSKIILTSITTRNQLIKTILIKQRISGRTCTFIQVDKRKLMN